MEAALPHFHRLASSRLYQQYAVPTSRLSSNYLHDLVPQQHPNLLQQYLAYYNEPLVPLDLSLKSTTPITPPCTPPPPLLQKRKTDEKSPKIFRHFEESTNETDQSEKRKDDDNSNDNEAKALISSIENKLGRYICRLCRRLYTDAFALAQHRCSRIVFNCPANLASHRRWHKPRVPGATKRRDPPACDAGRYPCPRCGKMFRRQAYLRKHLLAHEQSDNEPEKEPSAFRQEPVRDANFNTFWSKIPAPAPDISWEDVRPRCVSTCSSEDSRSLDVTGSEDEGGGEEG
ncbi:Uncharacterized protein OBRU01_01483 [Operophtera brumata]|uniref:C2H2-type domain-containing protein n=1 Tax=Operophtera brumata TaxID=104452 RepID=A0A0L7LIL6_OPEBR|nr:Uncharacterized protein OBRU01_01483 [Operophtera brumata]